jgi:hypothetical protein
MSALPPKVDIVERERHVRFVPIADSCIAAILSLFDTSSAVICMISGTVRLSLLADLRLVKNSNLVDCAGPISPDRIHRAHQTST